MVIEVWDTSNCHGVLLFQLGKKLKALMLAFGNLSRENYQGIHQRVDSARKVTEIAKGSL